MVTFSFVPMIRLIERTVCNGFATACRFATSPTIISLPLMVIILGTVRPPSAEGIMVAFPPSRIATAEFVVPKSIPIIFAIFLFLRFCFFIFYYDAALCVSSSFSCFLSSYGSCTFIFRFLCFIFFPQYNLCWSYNFAISFVAFSGYLYDCVFFICCCCDCFMQFRIVGCFCYFLDVFLLKDFTELIVNEFYSFVCFRNSFKVVFDFQELK